ncbi:GH25 family lysozyme [Limosilactobacillus mucosae]|uniref:GH25 family lysozyme n=1 Tax=Limosilactobacillus mucosae TaxID=97478 RepID=UPI0039932295
MAASSTAVVVANTDQEIALQALAAYSTSADAIDVSSYQGAMSVGTYSWLKSLGVKYVIVKLTQGTTYTNPYAQTQINNAREAGLTVATYDYAVFTDSASAIAEADHYANVASSYGLDGSTLMIADMEDNVTKRSNIAALLNEFWNELSRRGYTNHGVYASYSYDQTYNVSSTVGHSKTWIAAYYYNYWKNTMLNSDYGAWQYTDSFNGYDGSIDMGMFSTYMSLNGEKQENGYWYLYKNGVRQTGFQNLSDGRTVYYNSQGQMQYGEQKINGYWYYFNTSTGAMTTGFTKLSDGRTVYYNSQGQMQYGNQTINYNKYYFDTITGAMALGETTINGRNYYYNINTGVQEKGLVYNQNTKKLQYYDSATGALKTGVNSVTNGNNTIQLNSDGSVNTHGYTTGIYKIGSSSYYYDATKDVFLIGWQTISGKKYYFDTDTAQMTIGEKQINNYWYDFDDSGVMQIGFVKLSDGRLVNYNNQGQMYHGEAKINDKWYYFDARYGTTAQGWYKLPDGRQVYYDVDNNGNGQGMLHGMQKVGNEYYYFNIGYGTEESGLKNVNGKYYYFSPTMIKNTEKEVDGSWYYFGSDGAAKIGWYTLSDGRLVNYNDQGQMYHGEAKINDKWYYFDARYGTTAQGWYKLPDGRQVYYDVDNNGNGQGMLHGMQKVGNEYYYFNIGYGTEESGLKNVNGKYYYFSPTMIKNTEKEVDGSWYYFGSDGAAKTGWYILSDGRLVNYNNQGQMYHGEAKINDKWYYFDVRYGTTAQGWYKLPDGRQVYYDVDNNGNGQGMLHGMQKVGDNYYYFNIGYGTEESGLKNVNGKYYYFSPTMVKNTEKEVNGSWYYFGADGTAQTGWYTLADGRLVNYDSQGKMYHGEAKINGKWYYFDARYGTTAQGWYKLPDGRQVYYDVDNNGNGQGMLHGMQKVGNEYYYFNVGYGTEESGLKNVNGKYYYFDPEMITNTHKLINGVLYYFDKNGEGTISSTN